MIPAAYIISTGRSGTTLLGSYLAGHPELLIRSAFPYETRASQHLFVWASHGRSQGVSEAIRDPVNGVTYTVCQPGDEVSEQWFHTNQDVCGRWRAIDIAARYYEHIASIEGKRDPKWYIEKAVSFSLIPRMHQWGWPLRCVLLLRDPRDIFFSVKSFNRKRGFKSFGEESLGDKELFLSYLNFYLGARNILRKQNIPHIEVRYEELIESPTNTLGLIAQFLGVSTDEDSIGQMVNTEAVASAEARSHCTIQGGGTVARWSIEASPEQIRIFNGQSENLRKLGYS